MCKVVFFKHKTAYEMCISDWSSDVCSSDLMEIPDGGVLDPARVIHPKAEAEIAFTMGRDLEDPDASLETVIAAIDKAVPAIEIVDSRIADWRITFADTVADNGSSAFFVLGTARKSVVLGKSVSVRVD